MSNSMSLKAVAVVLTLSAISLAADPNQKLADPNNGTISGKVVDSQGEPVEGVVIVLCDQLSGIPVLKNTYRPFTENFSKNLENFDFAYLKTDANGSFHFSGVHEGEYRLIAQLWENCEKFKGIFEVNSKQIKLYGVAGNVRIQNGAKKNVELKPLGTGTLQIDEEMPNDETLIVVSTEPVRGDAILGFAGWAGPFMQNMIGGNRMPAGKTTICGLPEGKVYIGMFANDNVPGWAVAEAQIEAGKQSKLEYIQFVNSWSNSRHTPPDNLVPLFKEIKQLLPHEKEFFQKLLKSHGITFEASKMWETQRQMGRYLDEQVVLPTGTKTTFGDVMTIICYIQLEKGVKRKEERAKLADQQAAQSSTQQPVSDTNSVPTGQKLQGISAKLQDKWLLDAKQCLDEHNTGRMGVCFDISYRGMNEISDPNIVISHRIKSLKMGDIPISMSDSTGRVSIRNKTGMGKFFLPEEIKGLGNLKPGKYPVTLVLEGDIYKSNTPNKPLEHWQVTIDKEIELNALLLGTHPDPNSRLAGQSPKADFYLWGEAVDGLQLGLGFDLQDRPYRQGEIVSLKVLVRNTSDKMINLVHFGLRGWLPTILDSQGKAVPVTSLRLSEPAQKHNLSLSPGGTKPVGTIFLKIDSEPQADANYPDPHCYLTPGTYYIQQKFAFSEDAEANWSGELTTGKLAIEIIPGKQKTAGQLEKPNNPAPNSQPAGQKAGDLKGAAAGHDIRLIAEQTKDSGFKWQFNIDRNCRIRHGWVSIENGKVTEHVGGGGQDAAQDGRVVLELKPVLDGNNLKIAMRRHDPRDNSFGGVDTTTAVPDGSTLQKASVFANQDFLLFNEPVALWQGQFIRDNKPIKTVIYMAYLVEPNALSDFIPPADINDLLLGKHASFKEERIIRPNSQAAGQKGEAEEKR